METKTLTVLPSPLQALFHDLTQVSSPDSALTEVCDATYYRTRLFNAATGPNSLVAAAQPLLVVLSRSLNGSQPQQDSDALNTVLQHEIKAFVSRCQGFGYPQSSIAMARFLLCTALDDVIKPSDGCGAQTATPIAKLLDEGGSEHFFQIVTQIRNQPDKYIDLLELAYVIIAIGFSGSYRFMVNGRLELENTLQALYQTIRYQRGDELPSLLTSNTQQQTTSVKPQLSIHLGWLVMLALCLIFSLIIGFNYILNSVSYPIVSDHQQQNYTVQQHE